MTPADLMSLFAQYEQEAMHMPIRLRDGYDKEFTIALVVETPTGVVISMYDKD